LARTLYPVSAPMNRLLAFSLVPALLACQNPGDDVSADDPVDDTAAPLAEPAYAMVRLDGPARTAVYDKAGVWLATFTDGAYTVRLRGPSRTFDESTAAAPVTTKEWVRTLPSPFTGTVDGEWLATALVDDSPDILAIAMEYLRDAPNDADYGPLVDGVRQEGADFHDYLGIDWAFSTGMRTADPDELRSLDCSGFVRMVYGYRSGLPLSFAPADGAIPRRSFEILQSAPGAVVVADTGVRPGDLSALETGDLVFFDASSDDGTKIDHTGIYLGRDAAGRRRFISSRKSANGPTLGDSSGPSLLDGTYLYARTFRGARRL
jgi:hypothetical protein